MTPEQIEKLARALADYLTRGFDKLLPSKAAWEANGGIGPDGKFHDVNEPKQEDFLDTVRHCAPIINVWLAKARQEKNDRIEALSAENERLREELTFLANATATAIHFKHQNTNAPLELESAVKRARAALTPPPSPAKS